MVLQLKDYDGNLWPFYWDQVGNNIGIFRANPQCTVHINSDHPIPQDTRLAVGNQKNDGSRGVVTISGPVDHVSMAVGGALTGGLSNKFGMGNQGTYGLTMDLAQPAAPFHLSSLMIPGGVNLVAKIEELEARIAALE
jgi:hypothetical protein